jgi:DNA-binding LacI/PurR family transcriptional regulator
VRRREFIGLLGGVAAWPVAARAQLPERLRRIGVLMTTTAEEPETNARLTAFLQGMQELGWTNGRNIQVISRWGAYSSDELRKYAAELAGQAPDVILARDMLSGCAACRP